MIASCGRSILGGDHAEWTDCKTDVKLEDIKSEAKDPGESKDFITEIKDSEGDAKEVICDAKEEIEADGLETEDEACQMCAEPESVDFAEESYLEEAEGIEEDLYQPQDIFTYDLIVPDEEDSESPETEQPEADAATIGDEDVLNEDEGSAGEQEISEYCEEPGDNLDMQIDQSSEGATVSDEPAGCAPLGDGVPLEMAIIEPGWQIVLFDEGHVLPGAVAIDGETGEDILLGAGAGTYDKRLVKRITQEKAVTVSGLIADPDGVDIDSNGMVYVGGQNKITHVNSLTTAGGSDTVWHTMGVGGANINDLIIDTFNGDLVYVALNDGRVIRVAQDHEETEILGTGDEGSVALDDEGDIWVIRRNQGKLYEIDRVDLTVKTEVDYTVLIPGVVRTNRIVFNPADGMLYSTTYIKNPNRGVIARFDPENPDELIEWGLNFQAGDNDPDDIDWTEDGSCFYVSAPLTGNIFKTCKCFI